MYKPKISKEDKNALEDFVEKQFIFLNEIPGLSGMWLRNFLFYFQYNNCMKIKFIVITIFFMFLYGCSFTTGKYYDPEMKGEQYGSFKEGLSYRNRLLQLKTDVAKLNWSSDVSENLLENYLGVINKHIKLYAENKVKYVNEASINALYEGLNRYIEYLRFIKKTAEENAAENNNGYVQYFMVKSNSNYFNRKEKAIYWLEKSIENGYVDALILLSKYYGSGKYPDFEKTLELAVEALYNNVPGSFYHMGSLYESGAITEFHISDRDSAYLWYELGANKGEVESMYALGNRMLCYSCVHKNILLGKKWVKSAADRGHENAKAVICNGFNISSWSGDEVDLNCITKLAYEDANYLARSMLASYSKNRDLTVLYIMNRASGVTPYVNNIIKNLAADSVAKLDISYKVWKLRFIE